MDKLITALAPVFAAGFAVQQLVEILTSILDLDSRESFQKYKKAILAVVSLVLGLVLAYNDYLRVLQPLFAQDVTDPVTKAPTVIPPYLDYIVTALVISAGTEGINSILKFLKYKKEETKIDAAAKLSSTGARALADEAVPGPTPEALAAMNRK
jgi:hypothetical protein